MPLIDRLLTSTRKNIETNANCKLPVDIDTGLCIRNTLNFGADQIRILLFRECEWRGRKLLFDSITAEKNHGTSNSSSMCNNGPNTSCPRSGNGFAHECEKEICNNVNLLSEMVFGTVAMTYRGTLFKIHTLEFPRCVICTKVFPAPDHNTRKRNGKVSDDTLGLLNINDSYDNNNDSNSSIGSMRNTPSCPSSENISGNSSGSLRKNSTCSSNCSGWNVEFPIFPISTACIGNSEKSLETNSDSSTLSSGFGSYPSLRRRWLRALSTSFNHTEMSQMNEILGFQLYGDNNAASISTCDNIFDPSSRRHKTRLGLTIMIKLTPEREKEMELRLFEHATQLEAILDRLCHVCINADKERGLIEQLHKASFRCTCWLLRLLVTKKNNYSNNVSIWHGIILNKFISTDRKTTMLYRNFQQMCRVLDTVDTKSTNFFLSTLITAVLTYHLGWINTIITLKEKTWFENLETKYPCNPLWIQLSDLYGTLGNPSKRVHTIVAGDGEKSTLIDAILTFLSYFIRSAIVKKHYIYRDTSGQDIRDAISIIDNKQNKLPTSPLSSLPFSAASSSSSSSSSSIHPCFPCPPICRLKKQSTMEANNTLEEQFLSLKKSDNYNIPKLKKTSSLHRNLNLEELNCMKLEDKVALKLDLYQDDFDNSKKGVINTSRIKQVVEDEKKKNETKTVTLDQVEEKPEIRNSQVFPIANSKTIMPSIFLQNDLDPIKEAVSINDANGVVNETQVYFSNIEYKSNKRSQVFFTVGDEEKKNLIDETWTIQTNGNCNCQCSFAFTRVPSTSAQLPAGVLRKILQRNFPESSKSIQRPGTSFIRDKSFGTYCSKCNGSNINGNYESSKLLLETPTNATEVLRTCGASTIGRNRQTDCLDQLLEVNNFIELPMPRSKENSPVKIEDDFDETCGYINTLLQREIPKSNGQIIFPDVQYTAGLIIQGIIKKSNGKNNRVKGEMSSRGRNISDWLSELRDDISMATKHPLLDYSISETLCIVADIDNWQVGLISNTIPINDDSLLPVGMSRLVSQMLEAFVYLWTKHKSSLHCFNILESKMREIWLRSGALAQMIMTMDICNVNLACLTSALDLDAADLPLLFAIATTHSPQILQRIGFTYN